MAKVPSTPSSPDIGAINALDAANISLGDVAELIHGSTVATNAILERKGGKVGPLMLGRNFIGTVLKIPGN